MSSLISEPWRTPFPAQAANRVAVYIDESFTEATGTFVLAGFFAFQCDWNAFATEWEQLLRPYGTLGPDNVYQFKMNEMAMNQSRMANLPVFVKTIEKHVLGWICMSLNIHDIKRAQSRIQTPTLRDSIEWNKYLNPYYVALRCLLDKFHLHREKMTMAIPLDTPVDFIFDARPESKIVTKMWSEYIQNRAPNIRNLYGYSPRFVSDQYNLPLQACDLLAWWARKWIDDGTPELIEAFELCGPRNGDKMYLRIILNWDEDALAGDFLKNLRQNSPSYVPLYDVRIGESIRKLAMPPKGGF